LYINNKPVKELYWYRVRTKAGVEGLAFGFDIDIEGDASRKKA
jgi:hypothetical protein